MKRTPYFITGTDTGAGKTVFTALLARCLRQKGRRVAALKPVCSGERDDPRLLAAALGGEMTLDEINPWHFREPIAPVLAARREQRRVTRPEILAHARRWQKQTDWLLIEGAGGLLSPLAEGTDSRDLIRALRATPVIVGPNKLGVVNHLRLTLAALPPAASGRAFIVLMDQATPDSASGSNTRLLAEYFAAGRMIRLPWLGNPIDWERSLGLRAVKQGLGRV